MANENETVEQIGEEMLNDWALCYYSEGTRKKNGEHSDVCVIETEKVVDRILAAYKRKIAAHKRELVEKDAEIESLKWKVENYAQVVAAKEAEIAKIRALVKELADNALLLKDEVCVGCPQKLSVCGEQKCSLAKCTNALVAKAREVLK